MQLQEPNDCLLFTWVNRSVHRLSRISFRNRTHEFHLPKNPPRNGETRIKDGFEEMEHGFPFGILLFGRYVPFRNFPPTRPHKSCSIYFSYWFLGNIFVNGKRKTMSNSTDANFRLNAFETLFYFILLLGCLWHSSVLKWAWFFLLAQIALWRVQRVRKI